MNSFLGDAISILKGYVDENKDAPVIAAEIPFRMIVENPRTKTRYRMAGTQDQIRDLRNSNGGYEVFDLKTEQQMPNLGSWSEVGAASGSFRPGIAHGQPCEASGFSQPAPGAGGKRACAETLREDGTQ